MTRDATSNHLEIDRMVSALRAGDPRALGRAISLIENDTVTGRQLLSACFPHIGKARRVGITGAPGAGKSTLVDALAKQLRVKQHTVGIIAVDPTSPFSGGAILGDRIRMQSHHADPGLFIRSMATRGFLGGMARTTADVALVVEASGKDMVLLETVGVGQDELDVMRIADATVVVLVPGMGDDVQSIKAGLMEIADIFVINKSDRDGADRVEREIRAMQSLATSHPSWVAPIVKTIATTGEGISALVETIDRFLAWLTEGGELQRRRALSWQKRMSEMAREELTRRLAIHGLDADVFAQHAAAVSRGDEDPYKLIPRLLQKAWAGDDKMDRIDHLGIAVKSIAVAKKFYESLGLHVQHEETVAGEQVHTAMIPVGDSRIELLQATEVDSVIGRFIAKRGEGLHHVALHVDDIATTFQQLKNEGARLVTEEIKTGAGGHLYFFVHPQSTGGVLLEICQDSVVDA